MLFAYASITVVRPFGEEAQRPIIIGAKTFTEQYILSEALSEWIEQETGRRRRQPQRQPGLSTRQQQVLSENRQGLRPHLQGAELAQVRLFSRGTRQLLRDACQVPEVEGSQDQSLHRSGRIP